METIAMPIPLPGAPPLVPHEIRAAPPARRAMDPTKIPRFRTNLNLLCTGGPFLLLTFNTSSQHNGNQAEGKQGGAEEPVSLDHRPLEKSCKNFSKLLAAGVNRQ